MISTYLWLDFENTGLDLIDDDIIEIGAVITDRSLHPISEFSSIVTPREEAYQRLQENDFVRAMHHRTGLLQELDECRRDYGSLRNLEFVESNFMNWIDNQGVDTSEMYLCGSGVSHFDHILINQRMPKLASRLRYATIDVSVPQRFFENFVGQTLSLTATDSGRAHRALYDVYRAIEVAQTYRDHFVLGLQSQELLSPV